MPGKGRTYNFTDRKKAFGNFWLVYSNKTGIILKLTSDRELAHWALNLEFNPDVKSFAFDDFVIPADESAFLPATKYRAFVQYIHGLEYYRVSVTKSDSAKAEEKLVDSVLWRTKHIKFKHICDEDLTPMRSLIFPRMRLSAYLTSTKDQYLPAAVCEEALRYFHQVGHGSISRYLLDMNGLSKQMLMLHLYRLYNQGVIALDYEESPFGYDSKWEIYRHGLE